MFCLITKVLAFSFDRKLNVLYTMASQTGHWSKGLIASMNDPQAVVYSDDQVVIIKDKYPKAKFHFLVLPRKQIPSLKSVTKSDLPLLQHIQRTGEEIADRANQELKFRFGYHAVPSMSHLHMHVISQDFNSPCLKTKKHWNSFTSKYFIDSSEIIRTIQTKGQYLPNLEESNQLLKLDLRCHVCSKTFLSMPALKAHIMLHDVTKSSSNSTS